jgi:zinc protease
MRLIILPENVSDTVSVYGKIKNNPEMQAPEGQEGVDRVLNSLFSHGTKTLDRLAFQKALDDIAAKESAGSTFSLEVLAKNFDKGIQLLADNLLHPALPEDAFRVVQQETRGELSGLLQSPSYLSKRAMINALYPKDDPTQRQATTDTVAKLTLDDVRNYYLKVFRPDMTTIVIIGRVTPDQAKSVILKYFGNWKATGPRPATDLPPVPLNKPSVSLVPNASSLQDQVTLAETIGVTRAHPDYYKLQLGNHVLSGAFYATRLYRDLREDAGLVYTVESILEAGKTRSTFEVFYACDPSNVAKARSLVVSNLHMMQTTPISHEELNRTKALLARQLPLAEANIDNIAEELLSLSVEGLPLNEPVHAAENYLAITPEQLRDAFAKWIRPDDFVQIIVGPNP